MKSALFTAIFAVLLFGSSVCEGFSLFPKKTVTIANGLANNKPLGVHCKSAEDDLGAHKLSEGETFHFMFRDAFLGSTLFYCRFRIAPNDDKWFKIYDSELRYSDCRACEWKITENNACLYVAKKRNYDCYAFN